MAIAIGEISRERALRWFIGVFLEGTVVNTLMDIISSVNDGIIRLGW